MRRILVASFIAPIAAVAADQAAPQPSMLEVALRSGVTNERPYKPFSRIEQRYREVATVVARLESGLMAGSITTAPNAEISAAFTALEQDVDRAGSLTELERDQYESSLRDLSALCLSFSSIGIQIEGAPAIVAAAASTDATKVQAPETKAPPAVPEAKTEAATEPAPVGQLEGMPADAPSASDAPAEAAPAETAPTTDVAPSEVAPSEVAPSEAPPVSDTPPADAPVSDTPPADKPADAPVSDTPPADKPADAPVSDTPPADKPADAPVSDTPPADKPADKPAELPPE
jgi:hypothetical protein